MIVRLSPVMAEVIMLLCSLGFLLLRVGLCQRDCTGVKCPLLDNCIEEILDNGACCASCLQKGCVCEGYQHYDCINAGFKNGKVPEGDSYFVDYGSTECSCPVGGGRISCHFITCPDIPLNCIDFTEPPDGCMQCERVGCIHDNKKHEAGRSFHIDPCQVCHCPHEGGKLMCYPVPDCDPQSNKEPKLGSSEDITSRRQDIYPYRLDQEDDVDHISTQYHFPPDVEHPLFELHDYDSTLLPENIPQSLILPTQASFASYDVPYRTSAPESWSRTHKLELKEQRVAHNLPLVRQRVAGTIQQVEDSTASPPSTTAFKTLSSDSSQAESSSRNPTDQLPTQKSFGAVIVPPNQEQQSEKESELSHVRTESLEDHQNKSDGAADRSLKIQINNTYSVKYTDMQKNHKGYFPFQIIKTAQPPNFSQMSRNSPKESQRSFTAASEERLIVDDLNIEKKALHKMELTNVERGYKETEPRTPPPGTSDSQTTPTSHFTSTSVRPTAELNLEVTKPSRKLEQKPSYPHREAKEERVNAEDVEKHPLLLFPKSNGGPKVSDEEFLEGCCAVGQAWATDNTNCDHMTLLDTNTHTVCSVLQKQCCLSAVKDTQCGVGVASASKGLPCEDKEDSCSNDSFQVCCSCCALGLQMRREHWGCDIHQHLGYPCGHVFLTCCEEAEEDHLSPFTLQRMQRPPPTAPPKKVSHSEFPKEAFSVRAPETAADTVEEPEDGDGCRRAGGQLCQHLCINTWGSYRCGCHPGYTLQPDAHSCAPVNPEEDNRVQEAELSASSLQPTTSTTIIFTESPIPVDQCAGNGPCSQQCTVVGGHAHCSCFPGFSLMEDGHTCQDVDECVTHSHSCRLGQLCVNMVGSFVCEQPLSCPTGFQLSSNTCVDIDECAARSSSCGVGSVCQNTVGSFMCNTKQSCLHGFTLDLHGNCIDINECSSAKEPCNSASSCVNTVGSFTCQQKTLTCSYGYQASSDGTKCVDIDECQVGSHRCGSGQICHNLPSTYRCDCQTGYQYDPLSKVCNDVNECWLSTGRLCAQSCINTPGSFHCSCTAGFSLASDGKICEDINECDNNPCSQECANTHGSYQCYCQQGYYLNMDGHHCQDIDECSQSIGSLCAFQCVNVAGSYQCACPPAGYVMSANGHACRDIDECTSGTHNCSLDQSCYNLQGSFKCLSFHCPPDYKKVSDTRCERVKCPANAITCQNAPMRITYYQLSFQTNIITPAQIFRIGPSPTYPGDHILISITRGNHDGYFSSRRLNSVTGAVYLQRAVGRPTDFLIDVEMKLFRQGTLSSFLSRIHVFITSTAI